MSRLRSVPRLRGRLGRGPGALPRFRLRQAYGATGSEAVVNNGTSAYNARPHAVLYRLPIEPGAKGPDRRACKDRVTLQFLTRPGTDRRQRRACVIVWPCSPRPRYQSRRRLGEGGSEAALHLSPTDLISV
jgi:hypothetical protein